MKLVLLLAMMFISSANFAAVGQHNFQATVGGNMNYTTSTPNIATTAAEKKASKIDALGGGFDVTLGYLYLSQGSLIHGFDTKVRFGMNFSPLSTIGGEKVTPEMLEMIGFPLIPGATAGLNTTTFSVGTTYMLGGKVGNGRLMVNVLGLNLGYLTGNFKATAEVGGIKGSINQKTGNSFLVGIELPLGTQYIFDNGFSLGFSHRLDIALGGKPKPGTPTVDGHDTTNPMDEGSAFGTDKTQLSYMAYNLTVSLGYVFGK